MTRYLNQAGYDAAMAQGTSPMMGGKPRTGGSFPTQAQPKPKTPARPYGADPRPAPFPAPGSPKTPGRPYGADPRPAPFPAPGAPMSSQGSGGGYYSPPAPSLGFSGSGAPPVMPPRAPGGPVRSTGMPVPRKRPIQGSQMQQMPQMGMGGNMLLNMSPQLRQLLAQGFY